jgi:hypothetical protein
VARRAIGAGALTAGLTVGLAAGGFALPPGGVEDQPGTPPGSVTITTPDVPQKGKVGFCVQQFRVDTAGGPVGQQFMVKLDDFGSYGIGPFTPDATGSLCAEVSTDPADYQGAKGGAADKLPADLCDPGKEHWLRFLSGSWAHPDASQRSIAKGFRVTGSCIGTPPPTTAPGGGTPTTTAPGGTPTTPAGGSSAAAVPRVRSTTLVVRGRTIAAVLQGTGAFSRGSLVLRTRGPVRLGRTPPARRMLAKGSYQAAAGDRVTVRLTLTREGTSVLRTRPRLAGELAVTPVRATGATTRVAVRRAPTRTTGAPR